MFFNELDLLEIRLKELYDVVDVFVLAESNISHSGKPKEYIYENNKERFNKYSDKIRHIKVEDMPDTKDSWVREKYQRWSTIKGLTDMSPEDIIIVGDVDEIPRAEVIKMIKEDENNYERYVLCIPMFQFKLNYMKHFEHSVCPNVMVARGHVFTNPQQEREYTFSWVPKPADIVYIDHAGWHWSYLGDDKHAVTKIKNFAHTETDTPQFTKNLSTDFLIKNKCGLWGPLHLDKEKFEYVKVDEYFPKCITDHLDQYQHMIIPNAVFRVEDLYKR
jgi:beta-1,4-mannosyl-glycoprotein beta-1,4-N-acetylglucosaminyltransferase